jgi:hypothetical protein
MNQLLRTLGAVVVGLFLITLIAETIEFALVTAVNGSVTHDPAVYFGIRNRPGLLALKLVYNAAAGCVAGVACAAIAGIGGRGAAVALAALQAVALLWAISSPLAQWAPLWLWVALIITMTAAIVGGGALWRRRLTMDGTAIRSSFPDT